MKMTDREFDESIRRMCDSVEEMPAPGGWELIERTMARRSRMVWTVRACAAAAVAAAVILGLFLLPEGENTDISVSAGGGVVAQTSVEREPAVPVISSEPAVIVTSEPVRPVASSAVSSAPADGEPAGHTVETPAAEHVSTGESVQEERIERAGEDDAKREEPAAGVPSIGEQLSQADYLAFAGDEEKPRRSSFSIDASSDMYTLFGSGNVSFTRRSMSGGAGSGADFVVKPLNGEYPSHNFPITAGLGLRFSFGRFGIGTGVNYTFMKSSYEALVYDNDYYPAKTYQASVDQSVHYLGIPLTLLCDIVATGKLSFYALAGGMVEKGFGLKYRFMTFDGDISCKSLNVNGLQWSVNLGLGFEYRFVKFMGLYVDPKLTYYFYSDQPYSIRLEQPLQLNLNLGFRFHL